MKKERIEGCRGEVGEGLGGEEVKETALGV